MLTPLVLAQNNSGAATAGGGIILLIYLVLIVFFIATFWKIFTKAGQPGWAAIIPIYNMYIWCKIVGRPGWWVILLFIPLVSIVVYIILIYDLARSFGQGALFAVGMFFLSIIFYPILAFGSAQYQGPVAGT